LNVLALIKGNERYVFVYDDDSRQPLLDAFRAHAADPELSFNWFDAAVLTEKAREQARLEGAGIRDQESGVRGTSGRRFLTPDP
jgi:hypothetical protein